MQTNKQFLPELQQIEAIIAENHQFLESRVICEVTLDNRRLPIHALVMGSQDDNAPCMAFIGGVHGLERIGTQVVLAFLETLLQRLYWDLTFVDILKRIRIVFIPLLNPAGMAKHTRANGAGIDLMRNAPLDSDEETVWLAGGHRISSKLPWYRGQVLEDMQTESQALCDFMRSEVFTSPFSLVLDCHSGFGVNDRIWFPYAKSRLEPIQHIGEVYYLRQLFFKTYPHQNYYFEPQAQNYLTHGDLWDYLYIQAVAEGRTFLPLTLEMGSWRWVRKNPLQMFNMLGMFHPIKPHRVKRVLRRHLVLMEFLLHAALSYNNWLDHSLSAGMAQQAKDLWYGQNK